MDLGKIFDRAVQVFIALCAALGSYFAIYPPEPAGVHSTTAVKGGAFMSAAPWWAFALIATSVVLLLAMLALRRRTPQIHGLMFPINSGVYIGLITAGLDKLNTDLVIEITILGYNGTTKLISVGSVEGSILYNEKPLPTPLLSGLNFITKNIGATKEIIISLEQRVPRNVADQMLQALGEKKTIKLMLSSLNILAFFPPDSEHTTRLPLWDGLTIDMSGRLPNIGKITSLTALARLS